MLGPDIPLIRTVIGIATLPAFFGFYILAIFSFGVSVCDKIRACYHDRPWI